MKKLDQGKTHFDSKFLKMHVILLAIVQIKQIQVALNLAVLALHATI